MDNAGQPPDAAASRARRPRCDPWNTAARLSSGRGSACHFDWCQCAHHERPDVQPDSPPDSASYDGHAPGIARVRLSGDAGAVDALAAILRAHPAVEILTGPDKYSGGGQYLRVRVRPASRTDDLAKISDAAPEGASVAGRE